MTRAISNSTSCNFSSAPKHSQSASNNPLRSENQKDILYHPIQPDSQDHIQVDCVPDKSNDFPHKLLQSKPLSPISPATSVISLSSVVSEKNLLDSNKAHSKPQVSTNRMRAVVSNNTKVPKANEKTSKQLRRGKWTIEEEAYVARIIKSFNSGYLDAPAGTTLRAYLSDKLQCDPMRITKKFTGEACIGKRIFHPAVRCQENSNEIDEDQATVKSYEIRWKKLMNRESSKRSLSSEPMITSPLNENQIHKQRTPSNDHMNLTATYTASWLDQATNLLAVNFPQDAPAPVAADSTVFENHMNAVKKLIDEAPNIKRVKGAPTPPFKSSHFNKFQYMRRYSAPQIDLQEPQVNFEKLAPTYMKGVEFGSEMFPNVGSYGPENDRHSSPQKKKRKSFSTNFLPSMLKRYNTVDGAFSKTYSTSNLEDAEVLMDFMRSAR